MLVKKCIVQEAYSHLDIEHTLRHPHYYKVCSRICLASRPCTSRTRISTYLETVHLGIGTSRKVK